MTDALARVYALEEDRAQDQDRPEEERLVRLSHRGSSYRAARNGTKSRVASPLTEEPSPEAVHFLTDFNRP